MSTPVHPVLEDMLQLNCSSQSAVSLAFQVYMELSEVRGCWHVEYEYSPELDIIYFTTKDHQSQEVPELVVPLSASREISPARLDKLITILCRDCDKKVITLALKDPDSTIVFYKVYGDLEKPLSLEESQQLKIAEEKRRLMEADVRKRHDELYNIAKQAEEL